MIVGTLAFVLAAMLPAAILAVLLRPRPTAPCTCHWSIREWCVVHQGWFDRLITTAGDNLVLTAVSVAAFIFGTGIGVASLACGLFAESTSCYGGTPW